jgi:anti-sigma28 factor (negative regulator of flagellin synthesis)
VLFGRLIAPALIARQDRVDRNSVGIEAKGNIVMEIKNAASVGEIRSAVSQVQPDPPQARRSLPDSVSTPDTTRMADLARSVQARVGTLRTVRLAQVEKSIRTGNYQPSASQIASRLLDAAEIDSHMRALTGR